MKSLHPFSKIANRVREFLGVRREHREIKKIIVSVRALDVRFIGIVLKFQIKQGDLAGRALETYISFLLRFLSRFSSAKEDAELSI